jgi:taurine dioxygenase
MIAHEPRTQGFGAVVDLDLSEELTESTERELRELLDRYDLLVFPSNSLTRADQERVMASVGRGHVLANDYGTVSNRDPADATGTRPLPFHSDYAFLPYPIGALSLHALEVVDAETTTRFCSGRLAYETLPDDLRDRVAGLELLNVIPINAHERNRLSEVPPGSPSVQRSVVIEHPLAGVPMVFLSWLNVDCLVGLPSEESEALLEELAAHVYSPAHVYEHPWCNGDVVIWDNTAVTHSRRDVGSVGPRVLQRVSVGEYHFRDLYPDWRHPGRDHADAPEPPAGAAAS